MSQGRLCLPSASPRKSLKVASVQPVAWRGPIVVRKAGPITELDVPDTSIVKRDHHGFLLCSSSLYLLYLSVLFTLIQIVVELMVCSALKASG